MNPLTMMRMKSLVSSGPPRGPYGSTFGGPKRPSPYASLFSGDEEEEQEIPQQRNEASRYYDEMEKIRSNAGPGLSAYRQALQEIPTQEQHKPNWMTRIAAGLSGFGAGMKNPGAGAEVAMGINRSGYENAIGEYNNKLVGLKGQADIEQEDMEAQLRAISQARALGLKYDEFEFKKLESGKKAETDRMTAQASQERAKAYADAQRKPGYDTFPQVDGSVLYQNKNDRTDSFVVKADTIAGAQLKVSQRNADSQRMSAGAAVSNAATSSRNADTNKVRAQDYTRNVDSLIKSRGGEDSLLAPNVQSAARELAIKELELDPRFSKFVRTDEYDDIPDPSTFKPEEYQFFTRALEAKVRDILSRKR